MQHLFGCLMLVFGEALVGRQQPQEHVLQSAQSNQQFVIGTVNSMPLQQRADPDKSSESGPGTTQRTG